MGKQCDQDDDLLRRLIIERRYPLTWGGIACCALASIAGLVALVVGVGGDWEVVAAFAFVMGLYLALKGLLRRAWLRFLGTEEPVADFFRRRLGG